MGGLRSSIRGPYTEPLQIIPRPVSCSSLDPFPSSDDPTEGGEEEAEEEGEVEECTGDLISPGSKKKLDNVGDSDDDNPDGEARTVAGRASQQRLLLSGLQCHLRDSPNHKTASHVMPTPIPDHELHKLERGKSLQDMSCFTTCYECVCVWCVCVCVCVCLCVRTCVRACVCVCGV